MTIFELQTGQVVGYCSTLEVKFGANEAKKSLPTDSNIENAKVYGLFATIKNPSGNGAAPSQNPLISEEIAAGAMVQIEQRGRKMSLDLPLRSLLTAGTNKVFVPVDLLDGFSAENSNVLLYGTKPSAAASVLLTFVYQ